MTKAANACEARVLTDIPNIGKSIAQDLHGLGVTTPAGVAAMTPVCSIPFWPPKTS
jgi:DNA transformation protein